MYELIPDLSTKYTEYTKKDPSEFHSLFVYLVYFVDHSSSDNKFMQFPTRVSGQM